LFKSQNRLKDLIFLDIALDSSVRTAIERGFEKLNKAGPEVYVNRIFVSSVLPILWLASCSQLWNYLHFNQHLKEIIQSFYLNLLRTFLAVILRILSFCLAIFGLETQRRRFDFEGVKK